LTFSLPKQIGYDGDLRLRSDGIHRYVNEGHIQFILEQKEVNAGHVDD